MLYRLFLFISIISTAILTACDSNAEIDSTVNSILSEFEEVGISLVEKKDKSQTFIFFGSKEKQYEFPGGSIHIIYNFDDREVINEKIMEVFAESEFPYAVNKLDTDKFIIIFIADSENLDIEEKIESIFEKLKDT